jgi:hypothetical protein
MNIVKQYNIDIIDAAAIVVIKNGLLASFGGESGPFLITGDNNLSVAAKSCDVNVINLNEYDA